MKNERTGDICGGDGEAFSLLPVFVMRGGVEAICADPDAGVECGGGEIEYENGMEQAEYENTNRFFL